MVNNKFLDSSGSGSLSDGTANIFVASMTAANLDSSEPVKTSASGELVSSKLDISDVTNLQSTLNSVITNPVATLEVSSALDPTTDITVDIGRPAKRFKKAHVNIVETTAGTNSTVLSTNNLRFAEPGTSTTALLSLADEDTTLQSNRSLALRAGGAVGSQSLFSLNSTTAFCSVPLFAPSYGLPTPSANTSQTISQVDYSTMYPSAMRANITFASGGTNKCWGHTAKYIAGVNLLAGRVVALMDQVAGTDNSKLLEVEYLKSAAETNPTIAPIGVTQENATQGDPVTVCILGYTTAICQNSDSTPERGSQIINGSGNLGRVRINLTGGSNESRLGFVAQSDAVSSDSPILIHFDGWYQPY